MKTNNEKIQYYISLALAAAKRDRISRDRQGDYCAGYLARVIVRLEAKLALFRQALLPGFSELERETLAEWTAENMDYVHDICNDLDKQKTKALIKAGEFALGDYLLSKIAESKVYDEEFRDTEPDTLIADDARQRVNEAQEEENWIGLC